MGQDMIASEVYRKRRSIDNSMYAYQCHAAELKRWNMILIGIEMMLFAVLFILFFLMPENIAAIGIASLAAFILFVIQRFSNLDKMEAEDRMKMLIFSQALAKLDRQIDIFRLKQTSSEEQILWLDHFSLLEQFEPFSAKKWYHYQTLYTRNKKAWRSRMQAEENAR